MLRKVVPGLLLLGGVLLYGAAPAFADNTVNGNIGAGNNDTTVGTYSITYTTSSSPQTLSVTANLTDGSTITNMQVCLSSSPFSSRVNQPSCTSPDLFMQNNPSPATASDTITFSNVSSFCSGTNGCATIYAQVHVSEANGNTSFAGWQPGSPFYGNVEVAPTGPGSNVPDARFAVLFPIVGAGVIGGGYWLRRRRNTRRTAA